MENEILELLKQMQKDQQEMKVDIKSISGRLDRIESDIKDIKVDIG